MFKEMSENADRNPKHPFVYNIMEQDMMNNATELQS
jgi:hypothetical protein